MVKEQQSDHKLVNSILDEVIGLWRRVASLLSPWCAKGWRGGASGSEPKPNPLALRQRALVRSTECAQAQRYYEFKLFCEFQVRRRAPGSAPFPIQLDHGDLLVMDGLAQSFTARCLGCRALGLTLRSVG